jgi:uncharacterized membrane protein
MLLAELLAQTPLFQSLSDEDREALGGRMNARAFRAGDMVFSQGDAGSSMYLVQSGAVRVFLPATESSAVVVLAELRTGEYFGELAVFDDKPRSASVRALVDTVLLELTRSDLAEHLGRSKAAAMTILGEMASRLRETNALLGQRATKDAVREFEESLSWGQRLADRVAELNGSWAFILFVMGLTVAWFIVNMPVVAPRMGVHALNAEGQPVGFDPYPYAFYNLALAILVALQGPLIMMSQNRQSAKDRAQAETDFRVNLKNEVGIEQVLSEVGALRAESGKRLESIERALRAERPRARLPSGTES